MPNWLNGQARAWLLRLMSGLGREWANVSKVGPGLDMHALTRPMNTPTILVVSRKMRGRKRDSDRMATIRTDNICTIQLKFKYFP